MSADHMNYFNTTDFGPPTASSGGYYSLEDDQYDYSFPANQNTLEQYNLPPQVRLSQNSSNRAQRN